MGLICEPIEGAPSGSQSGVTISDSQYLEASMGNSILEPIWGTAIWVSLLGSIRAPPSLSQYGVTQLSNNLDQPRMVGNLVQKIWGPI